MDPNNQFQPEPTSTPTPAPQAPAEPSFQPAPIPVSPPGDSSKTKLIVIIVSIVAGIIVLAVAAWIAYVMIFSVSSTDYREAWGATNDVQTKLSSQYSDLVALGYISSYSTETQINNRVADLQESLSAYNAQAAKLAMLKAITGDAEAKKLYDNYKEKSDTYVMYSKSLVDSKSGFLAVSTCENIDAPTSRDIAAYMAGIKTCKTALNNATSTNESIKKITDAYKVYMSAAETYVNGMSTLSSSDPNYYQKQKVLYDEFSKALAVLQQVQKDANIDLKEGYQHTNPGEDLRAVSSYLLKAQS